ncbi:hypothetical protein Tco_0489584 [Tanacetum coccineum]
MSDLAASDYVDSEYLLKHDVTDAYCFLLLSSLEQSSGSLTGDRRIQYHIISFGSLHFGDSNAGSDVDTENTGSDVDGKENTVESASDYGQHMLLQTDKPEVVSILPLSGLFSYERGGGGFYYFSKLCERWDTETVPSYTDVTEADAHEHAKIPLGLERELHVEGKDTEGLEGLDLEEDSP